MDRIGDRPFQIYDLFEEERGLESDEAKEVLESKDEESWVPVKRARFNPVSDEELLNCLKREYQDYKDVNQYLLGTLKLDVFDCFSEFLGHYHKRSSGISKCSLLQAAIACKLPETALFLIRKMADLNYVDGMGWTALHYAVKYLDDHNASLEVIEQLIDEGCDPEVMDHLNRTALALALKDYKTKVVKLLIERGANVPDRIYDQPTLHYVVEFDDIELLKLILEKSRDAFYEIDEILGSVLHSAVYNFSIDIIKYFLEDHLEEIRRTKMDSLVINFRDVNVPLLQYVVSHEECDSYEKYNKTIPIINLLLEYGYGLEDRNELGQSMLQYVATFITGGISNVYDPGSVNALIAFLINKNADVFSKDNNGSTVLKDVSTRELQNPEFEFIFRNNLLQNHIIFGYVPDFYLMEDYVNAEAVTKIRALLEEYLTRDVAEEVVASACVPSPETRFKTNGEQINHISEARLRYSSLYLDGIRRGAVIERARGINGNLRLARVEEIKERYFKEIGRHNFESIRMNYVTVEGGFCLGGSCQTKNLELRGDYLTEEAITNALPSEIAKLYNLENVVLECLTDEILEALKGCEKLKNLALSRCAISRKQLKALMTMELDTLMISGVIFTEDDYRFIQNAPMKKIHRFIGEIIVEDEVREVLKL